MKILGTNYKVKYVDNLESGDWGYTDLINKKIVVVNNKQKCETLVHELCHAITYECGMEELSQDEEKINFITRVVLTVLKVLK